MSLCFHLRSHYRSIESAHPSFPLLASTTASWGPQLPARAARVRASAIQGLALGGGLKMAREVQRIKDRRAIELAKRIERVPVQLLFRMEICSPIA